MTINYQYPYGFNQPYFSQNPNFVQTPNFMYPPNATLPLEQSYVENILRLNRGKTATIYMNFENSQWGSKVFKGEITAAGKDHIILKDSQTGITYLLLTIYLSYVAFDSDIDYEYPFA